MSSSREIADINALIQHETIDRSERYPLENTYDIILQCAKEYGSQAALTYLENAARDEQGVTVSFDELAEKVTQTANLLGDIGLSSKDTVGILLPSLPETHFALWGGQAAGVVNPINPLLDANHIVAILNETKAKVLITTDQQFNHELWQKVIRVTEQVPTLESLLLVTKTGLNEADKKCATISIDNETMPKNIKAYNFLMAIASQANDRLKSERQFNKNDTAAYFHTGGTTGRPKVAQLTHDNIAFVSQMYADTTASKGQFATLCALPLFHIYGTIAAGIATLFCGRTVIIMTAEGFRNANVVKNWWHHIERFKVKAFATVPTVLNTLLNTPLENSDISCLQEITCGASPLSNSLKTAFEEKFNLFIRNGYGMTETSGMLARPLSDIMPPAGSSGTRLPYMEMRIAKVKNNQTLHDCGPNEAGSVLARGPHVFSGYLNKTENDKVWIDQDWFDTGDIGYCDIDGNLFLTGRSKDLIIRGGHNIDPALIEDALDKHPAVTMAVAIGQPDLYAGELPVAYVTINTNNLVSANELLCYCEQEISERAAIPKRIEILDIIPQTAVGKVYKPALRNLATEFSVKELLTKAGIYAQVTAHFEQKRGQVAQLKLNNESHKAEALETLTNLPIVIDFIE